MPTPHNSANPGDFAKTVLMPGDPLRAKFIAENFLENPRLVSSVRNVYAYTGTYKGVPVSVMASGMGQPSIGIYSYELYQFYGVENIIRVGSAGSYDINFDLYDVVVVDSAYSGSNFAKIQNGCEDHVLFPSADLNRDIAAGAEAAGIPVKYGRTHSSDVFYAQPGGNTPADYREKFGCVCVEMESFALFHNANVLGKHAACLLTISDSMVTGKETTAEERQNSFTSMMKVALEAAVIAAAR